MGGRVLGAHLSTSFLAALQSEIGPVTYVADPSHGALVLAQRLVTAAPAQG
jgi:hypothetical protein